MWQPIETAPLDGTALLLINISTRTGHRQNDKPIPFVGFWYRESRWGGTDRWVSIPGAYGQKPTHWMPLPDNPN